MHAPPPTQNATAACNPLMRPRLIDRVRLRLCVTALDRELANGAPPETSRVLALRARELSRPSVSDELGTQLRRILRDARQPVAPGSRVCACRGRVIAAESELRLLASRLHSPRRAAVRGLAKVRVLLTDGSGPLYYRDSVEDLGALARDAGSALS